MEVTLQFRELNEVKEVKNALGSIPKENLHIFERIVDTETFQPGVLIFAQPVKADLIYSYKYKTSLELLMDAGIEFTLHDSPTTIRI